MKYCPNCGTDNIIQCDEHPDKMWCGECLEDIDKEENEK